MSTGRILILDEVRGRLAPRGAILTGDHVVLTPKAKGHFHAPGYFDKDRVLSDPVSLLAICHEIARRFADDGIEAIAAPTIAGVSLAAVIAVEMYRLTGQDCLNWGYAEEVEEAIEVCRVVDGVVSEKRETLLVPTKSRRVIKRCFPDYFKGKRTIVVDGLDGQDHLRTIRLKKNETLVGIEKGRWPDNFNVKVIAPAKGDRGTVIKVHSYAIEDGAIRQLR